MGGADRLRRQVFIGCRDLGLDEDGRRDLVQLATGKPSMKGMGEADLKLVVGALKERGFQTKAGRRHKLAPRADLRLVHRFWTILGEAGALDRPGRDGLNAFIRARFGDDWGAVPRDIDDLRDHKKINAVVTALKAMARRKGVSLERQK